MLARMSVLDAQGRFVRQVRLDPAPSVLTCARNGTLVYFGQPITESSSLSELETARYSAPLWIGVGEVARVVDTLPLGEPRPLGRVSRLAASGDRIAVGTSDSATVEVRDREGGFVGNVLLMRERRPATRAHYEHAIDRQLMQLPSAADRAPVRALMLDMPMPEYLPAYSGIVADPGGRFWVQVSVPGDSTTEIVIIAEGANPQTVRVPIALDVLEVGHDYLLASYQNADGEEHVGLFPLHHPE
jgi:hypothetical protein